MDGFEGIAGKLLRVQAHIFKEVPSDIVGIFFSPSGPDYLGMLLIRKMLQFVSQKRTIQLLLVYRCIKSKV